jgi:drug/metabolite transporter (DMT)-like permease
MRPSVRMLCARRSDHGKPQLMRTHVPKRCLAEKIGPGHCLMSLPSTPRSWVAASYAVVCVVWGSTYLATRVALEGFPPFLLGAARFLAAGAVLVAYGRARGQPLPTRAEWLGALATGTLFFGVGNGFVNMAERSVSSGMAAVLVATMPLWTTVCARLFGQRVARDEALGVVLGLTGVGVLHAGGDLRGSAGGAVLGLLAPLGWALGTLASTRLPGASGTMRSGAQMLAGGAVMLAASAALGERMSGPPSARAIGAVAYLCVFGSLGAFSAFSYLLSHTRPTFATSYAYVNPLIAVALGVALANEPFGLASAAGSLVILASLVVVARARSRVARPPVASPAPPSGRAAFTSASPRGAPARRGASTAR